MQRLVRPALAALIVMLLVSVLGDSFPAVVPAARADSGVTFQVDVSGLYGRSAPSRSAAVLISLFRGQRFPVIGRTSDNAWVQLDLGGSPGKVWSFASYGTIYGDLSTVPATAETAAATPAAPAGDTTTTTTTSAATIPPATKVTLTITYAIGVFVRNGPSTSYKILGSVVKGQTFAIRARNAASNWVWIDHPGLGGETWVWRFGGDITGNLTSVPVASSPVSAQTTSATPAPTASSPATEAPANPLGFKSSALTNARTIYLRGQALGNNPNRFSRVADSVSLYGSTLGVFEPWKSHDLGDHQYLQAVIDRFSQSFDRRGITSFGLTTGTALDPAYSVPWQCGSDSPLVCEYKTWKPSVTLIMFGTNDVVAGAANFEVNLRKIVQASTDLGVVPVLRTIPWYSGCAGYKSAMAQNEIVRRVASDMKVPLWDLFKSLQSLPNQGMGFFDYDSCGAHLSQSGDGTATILREPYLQYGQIRQNLEALQALYTLMKQAIY